MKKIYFNDKFGLTNAVLQGTKTMTRRLVGDRMTEYDIIAYLKGYTELANNLAQYKIGEVVAVAQSYKDAGIDPHFLMFQPIKGSTYFAEMEIEAMFTGGWNNKMFVKPELMPHQIRITDIKVERLQDCSDDDILKEGIFQISAPIYRHYNGMGYTFKGWTERGVECSSDTPKGAFKALIDKTCGRGTFESNPYVFAYSFNLF